MPVRLRIGPFRGLTSYLEEDQNLLFGRDRERADLFALLQEPDASVVLVTGESGVGKTSLIRAGLIPSVPGGGWLPLYLECGGQWRRDLAAALSLALQRPVNLDDPLGDPLAEATTARRKSPLLALDHVEQLLWLDEPETEGLGGLVGRVVDQGGKVVLVLDQGHMHALERIADHLPPVPESRRLAVERMDRETAAKVMEQTVIAGGGYMEAGLPELIAEELAAEGPVLPAMLQAVGHAALLLGATRTKRFSRVGGAQALSALYVERLVARAGGWRARRVLAMLTEHNNPRHVRELGSVAEGCGLNVEVTRTVLDALEREGLVATQADPLSIQREPRYGIVHPYLLQSIRDTVAPVLRGRAQARLSLRRRIHERGVLRPDEIVRVWRYLGAAVSKPEWDLVRRGLRVWALVAAALVALPIAIFLMVYAVVASSSYVDTVSRLPGIDRVVVRAGRPGYAIGSSGEILVDSGLLLSSLPQALRERVRNGDLIGERDTEADPYWLNELWASLPRVRRGALQILAGDNKEGGRLLNQAAGSDAERRRATWALAVLSGDGQPTLEALLLCMKDNRPEVRRMAVVEAQRLGAQRALRVLTLAIRDADNQIRLAAVRGLERTGPAKEVLGLLGEGLQDADPRVQSEALALMTQAAAKYPVEAFEVVRKALARPAKAPEALENALERLLHRIQQRVPDQIVAHLMRLATSSDDETRVEALGRLAGLADRAPADKVLPLVRGLAEKGSAEVQAAALPLQARFGDPDEMEELLTKLAYKAARMRRAAATGLGLVQQRPGADRLKLLKRLLQDPDPTVRAAAAESLVRLGAYGLADLVKGIKNGPKDVALVALGAVCKDSEPDRRVATTILATVWQLKREGLRGSALGCARKLVAANPRLSVWLAEQARMDKSPDVRRAAAEAVALSVRWAGQRAQGLVRFYLRQQDPTIPVAVLQAITRTPPKPAAWLFREISKHLGHRDPTVRAASAPALAAVAPNGKEAAVALDRLLADGEPAVVRSALEAARRLRRGAHTKRLDRTLAAVVAAGRSKDAIAALGLARKLELPAPLQQAAVHPEPDVRAAAVALLAQKADPPKALAVLESALRDAEPALRLAALDATAKQSARLGEPAVELLVRSTRAASPAERWAAFEALGQVTGKAIPAAVRVLAKAGRHRSEERRRLAMRSLGALAPHSNEAAQALVEGALDPALDVRTEAQAVLARFLGQHCPIGELTQLLVSSQRNALQRHLALSALAWNGRIHDPAALQKALAGAVGAQSPKVIRMAANLALALSRRQDRPEEVIGWLYGW